MRRPDRTGIRGILRHVEGVKVPCHTDDGERRYTIASIADASGVEVPYGRADGEGELGAAFIDTRYDAIGNSIDLMDLVLRLEAGR